MIINPFDESPGHREIVPYDKAYEAIFSKVKAQVESAIETVELFHIGSTAIPDLRGKPMVDIVAVSSRENLRNEQSKFIELGFHRRAVWVDTDDKPYVCGSVISNSSIYNINIHICHQGDWIHTEGSRFVDALKSSGALRRKYEQAKVIAHAMEPSDPEKYNRAKEQVIDEIYREIASRL
jgi:GrpB-like predicted nucleotidyltransferase (UPF0157 family)